MARNGYKFIDPDLHVYEPADPWLRYLEPKYRDQAPIGSDEFVGDMYLTHEGRLIARGGMAPVMGDDNIVFSTDFPHEDSRYPHALETFLEMPFGEDSRHKILWHNSARLYGLD